MSMDYEWTDLNSVSGTWQLISTYSQPCQELPRTFAVFGLTNQYPQINIQSGQETLLFTFKKGNGACPDEIRFTDENIDIITDYYACDLYSVPFNEIIAVDPLGDFYEYSDNYAPFAWDCHDNDGDGIANALEDTNGNGTYEPSEDDSDLNSTEQATNTEGIQFKLQLMPDGERWGVYAKPTDNIVLSTQVLVGSAQVTIVMPLQYNWIGLESVNGVWNGGNATVHGPSENPDKSYVSFGLVNQQPNLSLKNDEETLLFTFRKDDTCPSEMYLLDNQHDPFNQLPNSLGNNPGNDITVLDFPSGGMYLYVGNYGENAWDCHDNDGDGIANALEDTNGNGIYDPNEDASDLNTADVAAVNGDIQFKLQLMPDGEFWGVYAKPKADADISQQTVTGTAQVTVVMPASYQWSSLTSVSGTWNANSVVNGPVFAADKQYLSFGLVSDVPKITFRPGEETLLFKFKKEGSCPSDLHLYPSDGVLPPNSQWNLGNEITIIDVDGYDLFGYAGNYAEMAWDCNDNDADGVANALEDTNGNGVFDPAIDASDLNEINPASCLKLKLQLLPDSSGWAVVAKASGPLAHAESINLQHGRVTIVYPASMDFDGYDADATGWSPSSWTTTLPNNPGRKYTTFETSGSLTLDMTNNHETTLFQLPKNGDCPDFLYIMEVFPATVAANELRAFSTIGNDLIGFNFCDVYARKAWRCQKPGGTIPSGPIIIVTEDDLGKGAPNTVVDRNESQFQTGMNQFTAYPNPAFDYVDIAISPELAEGQPTLSLFDLQGRKRLDVQLDSNATRLDLSSLPAGVYFVSLAQNGQLLQRTKLIKQ